MTSPFEERIKSGLNERAEHLDTATRQRLQNIRREALNQSKKTNWLSMFSSSYWMPAAGLTICGLFATLLFLPQLNSTQDTTEIDQTAMIELLDSPEDLEVISDPGFYLWIDELEAQSV